MTFDPMSDGRPGLLVELRHDIDDATIRMAVAGELDAETAGRLQQPLVEALRHYRPARIELDVGGISFLDSGGIWSLISCHAEAQRAGCHLALLNTPNRVYRVLQITGLLEHFGLEPAHPVALRPQEGLACG
jgi:anti-anti-sigma factor